MENLLIFFERGLSFFSIIASFLIIASLYVIIFCTHMKMQYNNKRLNKYFLLSFVTLLISCLLITLESYLFKNMNYSQQSKIFIIFTTFLIFSILLNFNQKNRNKNNKKEK